MSTYTERLKLAVETYRALQSESEGGWGEDRWEGAPCSIVNTAEVLCVFKAANVPYTDRAVQRALEFLSKAVEIHPLATRLPGGRGSHARYCAFGLLGLTLFKESRHDPEWEAAQAVCVEWLRAHSLQGGWPEHPRNSHPSLTSTHAAVVGLSRICPRHELGEDARDLAEAARKVVFSLSQQRGRQRCWANSPDERTVSPAATALAVLTLSRGSGQYRKAAVEGANWLYGHVDSWATSIEGDSHMKDANWRQMSFSLCLRAVLTPPAAHSAADPVLKRSLTFLDRLWDEEEHEWRHGHPEAKCSPTGSCAAVLAFEAVRRAWPLDPALPRARRRRSAVPRIKPDTTVEIGPGWAVSVIDLRGKLVDHEPLSPKLGSLLVLLARRRAEVGADAPLEARTMTAAEIAKACEWPHLDTVRRNAERVNKALRKAAQENERSLGSLVQRMNDAPNPERRWGLNVDSVVIHPDLLPRDEAPQRA